MYNEILGLVTFIATFVLMVLMYRFFGKQGLIAWVAIGTIIANIQVIKTVEIFGISSTLIMIIVMQLSLHFIPAPEDMAQKALHAIFDVVPRIALGSIVAYIIGQHIDVFIFSLIKKVFSSDKTFFIRAYGSTFLSSIIDTALFVAIAFIGSLPGTVVFEIFITTYVLKLASTVFNVPFGYIAKSFYRKGKIDKLDQGY